MRRELVLSSLLSQGMVGVGFKMRAVSGDFVVETHVVCIVDRLDCSRHLSVMS